MKSENENNRERFEFVLKINDNIICQRYFRINGYNDNAPYSQDLLDTFRNCVRLIKGDLEAKSRIYLWHSAVQVFDSGDIEDIVKRLPSLLTSDYPVCDGGPHPFCYILIKDKNETYFWDGKECVKCDTYINRSEYVKDSGAEEPQKNTLTFTFLENGREILSEAWDANAYPRFVRMNIDLSNSRNKYRAEGIYAPFDSAMIDLFNASQTDLIPTIVRELCIACSYGFKDKYTFGMNGYETHIPRYNNKLSREWRRKA